MTTIGRFAPSPSGRMHLGNLFCYLLAWLSARQKGGRVVLRIEDLDTQRCTRRHAQALEEDLLYLGLTWDEGGFAGGAHAPYLQSERTELYTAALAALTEQGMVYPCFCTRSELHAASAPHLGDGQTIYPGTCRELTAEQAAGRLRTAQHPPALRLRVPPVEITVLDGHMGPYTQDLSRECGDFLLRRSDGMFAYQLAVVVDDAAMNVSEVVRGADLLSSTPRQVLLDRLLGFPEPAFYHLPLLLSGDGRRLSKRDADAGLASMQNQLTPEQIIGRLAYLAGLNPSAQPRTPESLVAEFNWAKVPRENLYLPDEFFSQSFSPAPIS